MCAVGYCFLKKPIREERTKKNMIKKKYKILNLYACLGGNRYKWDEVADNLEVTAVELDSELARMYQKPMFPDMKLYEEILFLENYFDGKYVVENVIAFYDPLIAAKKRSRHLYWTNFNLPNSLNERKQPNDFIMTGSKPNEKFHKIDLTDYKGTQRKDKIARNLVDYEAGKTILETVFGIQRQQNINQINMFP